MYILSEGRGSLHGGDGEEEEEDERKSVADARVAVVPAAATAATATEAWADEEESEKHEPHDCYYYERNSGKSNRLKENIIHTFLVISITLWVVLKLA